ncbi:GNAT family N-acetyltransferase [Catenovulum sp. SM1970]|uniref:GNAT family N-acetyltransferase n=1 Tax=Marinifaba aquimaris TaxID=2741323 RepID=UPI0015730793|nr:GNAT family N-acetyltransferase [Marinifaba aquimaris]NTS76795.1 GNAT family N-acetyltransferase [Marinifaba aquimaris]
MIETERLILRQWVDSDLAPFTEMCADKDVMRYFPHTLDEEQCQKMFARIHALIAKRGWGFWAVETKSENQFIGFVGLHTPNEALPFAPCVEIGWRLAKAHWRQGFATEAARASLKHAFEQLKLDEIVSFTATSNIPSQAVMQTIGMQNSQQNFFHPDIANGHPLQEHVLYKINKHAWQKITNKGFQYV